MKAARAAPHRNAQRMARGRWFSFVKLALPVVGILVLASVLLWPWVMGRDSGFRLSFEDLRNETQEIALVNARFHGIDGNNQPYMISAARAAQDPQDARLIHLSTIQADISQEGGDWFALSADEGVYNQETEILILKGNVAAFSNQGYEAFTDAATVLVREGRIETQSGILMNGPDGKIEAGAARYDKNEGRILFSNRVKLRIERGT